MKTEDRQDNIHAAVQRLMQLDRAHRKAIDRSVGDLGLHRSQHMMLMYLSHHPEQLSQTDLARHFRISTPAVAGILKKLEKDGYIIRSARAEDTRHNEVVLTEKGRTAVSDTKERFEKVDAAMLRDIDAAELDALLTLLNKMQHNLEQYEEMSK